MLKLFRLYLQYSCLYIHFCWQVLGRFKNRKSLNNRAFAAIQEKASSQFAEKLLNTLIP
jgi:hypothetical protein